MLSLSKYSPYKNLTLIKIQTSVPFWEHWTRLSSDRQNGSGKFPLPEAKCSGIRQYESERCLEDFAIFSSLFSTFLSYKSIPAENAIDR